MSLFLGNLSPNIRQNELERVFRRFGRNNVRLKDGYGFVVYDIPRNAEEALRALRGKPICGKPLVLSWSKKQPRPVQRFRKHSKVYEPYKRRKVMRSEEDHHMRKTDSDGHVESNLDINNPGSEGQRLHMGEFHVKEPKHLSDEVEYHEGEHHKSEEGLQNETKAPDPNLLDDDRWDGSVSNLLKENVVENGMDFDRYEPYHGNDRDEEFNHRKIGLHGSPARATGEEKQWREHTRGVTPQQLNVSKPQQMCYICSVTGHKMRDCPLRDAPRRDKHSRLDHRPRRDAPLRNTRERGLKRVRCTSLERSPPNGNPPSSRHHKSRREASGKPGRRNRIESSSVEKETHQKQRKRDSHRKKTSKREQGSAGKYIEQEKAKSSTRRSDCTASSSNPSTKPSVTISYSSSRSISSQTRSRSSRSNSTSASSYSKSNNQSGSRSSSSPSTSLDQPLPSSSLKVQRGATIACPNDDLENDKSPNSHNFLIEQRRLVEGDSNTEKCRLKGKSVTSKDESMFSSFKVVDETNGGCSVPQEERDCSLDNEEDGKGRELEKCTSPAESLPSEVCGEKSNTLQQPSTLGKTSREVPDNGNSTSIWPEEMYMVLKHYGLEVPEENESHLSVEAHFGSARLWPWEIIYYRRPKKGPISIKNYARRIAQNKEYGIVDKYIRSSSGWCECDQSSS